MVRCKLLLLWGAVLSILINADVYAHAGPLNELALQACDQKVKSQACRYEGEHKDLYLGTCQYMGESLMCVRNQPIQQLEPASKSAQADHSHKGDKQ